jgi:hypothetical protein
MLITAQGRLGSMCPDDAWCKGWEGPVDDYALGRAPGPS